MTVQEDYCCRICCSTQYTHYCHIKDETTRNTGLEFDYVRCAGCSTLSLFPLPTLEQLTKANETLLGITRPGSSFDKRYLPEFRDILRNDYLLTFADLGVEITPPFPGANCLDFGCAVGSLLDLMAEAGWETYGIDVSRQLTDLADKQRHRIHVGKIDTLPADWGPFDLVVTIEVLEHLPDPREVLTKLVELLKPGGIIITETPQVGLLSELYGDKWRVLVGPDHIHLMTQATQFRLLSELNCRIERWISFGSGCTTGLTPPHIKKAFDDLVKRLGLGDFLAIKAVKGDREWPLAEGQSQ